MKVIITNLALFVVFAIAFSSFTACNRGTQPNASNGANASNTGAANAPANANSQPTDTKASTYPMLSQGLADAEIEMLDGSKSKISDHKGKAVLVNLWGIWCGPCVAEMPQLSQFQQTYGDRGLEVIGLNVGDQNMNPEDMGKIKAFVDQKQFNYTFGRVGDKGVRQFYLLTKNEVVPQTILVDRDGRLRGVFVGGGQRILDSMKETIEKTLSE